MNIRPYIGWAGDKNVRLASYSSDAGSTWSPPQPVPALPDWGFADEGSTCSDPRSKRLHFVHPDSHARENLTVWTSADDGRTWAGMANVFPGPAAYSDCVVLDPSSDAGQGREVGVLFERDSYEKISFVHVETV